MHNPPEDLFRQVAKLPVSRARCKCGGNQARAARLLDLSRNALRTLLRREGID